MIVGSLAILVALILLLRSITKDSPAATATEAPPSSGTRVATTTTSSPSGAARSAPMPPSIPRPRTDDSPRAGGGESAPALAPSSDDGAPGTRQNTKNLQFGLPQLREKIAANAAKVAECIGTSKPTGEATLTFILAQRQGKIVVEQTDVDREKTTLQDEQLVECLHKTALAMQFDGLPREADAIIVTRSIALQDGAVTEDKPVKFSYLR